MTIHTKISSPVTDSNILADLKVAFEAGELTAAEFRDYSEHFANKLRELTHVVTSFEIIATRVVNAPADKAWDVRRNALMVIEAIETFPVSVALPFSVPPPPLKTTT